MTEERVNQIITELDRIREIRKERGNLFLDAVLDSSKSIKEKYVTWYERAFEDLFIEIDLINELVPYEELNEQKKTLESVKEKFNKNVKALEKFISSIEKGEIKSFADLKIEEVKSRTSIPKLPDEYVNFSSVIDAISIANEIEEIERSVERISRFVRNVIILVSRIYS